MALPFFTVGHSTHQLGEFIDLLAASEIGTLVDVRTVPRSRTNPQFNTDTLPGALAGRQIGYEHVAALGGLRPRAKDVPPHVNGFWENQSFHNYADYAMSAGFRAGLAHLREVGHARRCAVMCAEAVWWRCHRRIIADYLIAAGEEVFHILGSDKVAPATLTPGVQQHSDGTLTYPAAQPELFTPAETPSGRRRR
ncbi:MAG TPA: DUF488 domain-containing protein [Pseudolabrys sp.]|nr:DUF488 domain-containing protein [Pseudolabrys sp.]